MLSTELTVDDDETAGQRHGNDLDKKISQLVRMNKTKVSTCMHKRTTISPTRKKKHDGGTDKTQTPNQQTLV